MRSRAAKSVLLVVLSFAAGAGTAEGALPTQSVLNSPHGEFQPAAGSGALSWERNTRRNPEIFNVFARIGGEKVRVNAPGTQGANGGIDDGQLIYQQYAGDRSDIKLFDLATRTRSNLAQINTPNWEYWPSMSDNRLFFGRLRPSGARRIILFDTVANSGLALATSTARSRFLAPGQVNGDYATWYKCTPNACNVFGHRISTGETFKVPNPGKFQRASSVGPDGTVYFARTNEECGVSVRLMAYRDGGVVEKLTQLPDGRDINDTYAMSETPGSTDVFYENSDCDTAHRSDIFKVVHVSGLELSVTKAGDGTGTVTSAPAGIDCGDECSALFDAGAQVTLTATSAQNSTFLGWNGEGCFGTGTCTVTMDEARSVIATFEGPPEQRLLTVTKNGTGVGTVASNPTGINCGADCSEGYPQGTQVVLSATAGVNSTFVAWTGGGCSGTGTCTVTMDVAKTVTATFNQVNTLSVTTTGNGFVTSNPSGINCGAGGGSDCAEAYQPGTVVTLRAFTDSNSTFTGWTGTPDPGCGTANTCQVTMNGSKSVTATFTKIPRELTVAVGGTGAGTVTSSPEGINCSTGNTPDCAETYGQGDQINLTAAPEASSTFTGWGGDAPGACGTNPTCQVTMNTAKGVTATFAPVTHTLTVGLAGGGDGNVGSGDGGIDCSSPAGGSQDCTESYDEDTVVTLTATETNVLHAFTGWTTTATTTTCSGTTNPCTVTMDAAQTVTATFDNPGARRSMARDISRSTVWERLLSFSSAAPAGW